MVDELTSGTCIALEVKGPDAQNSLRQLCGPHDPEIARHLRPNTLRAMFGSDKIKNGVHCTDLAEDAILEVSSLPHSSTHTLKEFHSLINNLIIFLYIQGRILLQNPR